MGTVSSSLATACRIVAKTIVAALKQLHCVMTIKSALDGDDVDLDLCPKRNQRE